ncbi:hypothetical protein CS063_16080 [Sporanaerobium hydrogeniformans]|uniref:Uncharacterized protein n=1 Tax=Sporanaerobium hydrogeniformans TaxID=3072179 RepID=A0AC61D730_9FIRM|nr:HAMP domain-containing sensor histidine kinase [Sporanaerobium hydrogeniformans]PHV69399.1 hypothetical protein CS063_16080 [Sporanaerobium hydrogeniformans]
MAKRLRKNKAAKQDNQEQAPPRRKQKKIDKEGIIVKVKSFHNKTKSRIEKSLKLEILGMVAVALGVSTVAFVLVKGTIHRMDIGRGTYYTYDESRADIESNLLGLIRQINEIENTTYNPVEQLEQAGNLPILLEIVNNYPKPDALVELEGLLANNTGYSSNYTIVTNGETTSVSMPTQEVNVGKVSSQEALETLYMALIKMNEQGNPSLSEVKEKVEQFYTSQGFKEETIKKEQIKNALDQISHWGEETKTYLMDSSGEILYQEGFVQSLDIKKVIQKVNEYANYGEEDHFAGIYPVIIDGAVHYLFNDSRLSPTIHYYYRSIGNFLGFITGIGIFTVLLFRFIKPKIDYIEYLSHCLGEISKGDLNYQIEAIGEDELAQVAQNITFMETEIKKQIEAQMKAEKVKNELITNVAHDLRTPLTSIIGYIGLVKNKQFMTDEEEAKYLDIAYGKSEKLKVLIEDLFELTKLHQQDIQLNKEIISLANLVNQLVEELMPLANEKNMELTTSIQAKEASIRADIPKITRVFENLIGNAIKYSEEGEHIQVELRELPKEVNVIVTNPCKEITEEEVEHFFDRFYRGDKSRNSLAGGSGLGLAIAKNIVELHGGKISAKLEEEKISFKVRLPKFRRV